MKTPSFLDIDHVLRLHQSLIKRYGGPAGTRDTGLLLSAIAMPQAAYGGDYLHSDIFEMAALICTISSRIIRSLMEISEPVLQLLSFSLR